jgi:hypothetical protein
MTDERHTPENGYLYDATLTELDSARGMLVFRVGETLHRVASTHLSSFSPGAVGRLQLPAPGADVVFHVYPDQRLRRVPPLDDPAQQRWGWRIGERQFTVQAALIPGRNGNVVRRDTQTVPFAVPREFIQFCESRGLTPNIVLRAFVADLCQLTNSFVCPREDGYSSNSSTERDQASAYFRSAFGWVETPEYRAKLRAARRGARKHA